MKLLNFFASAGFAAGIGLLAFPAQAGTAIPMDPCPSSGFTLDTFVGGGATVGCSIGDKNFSNFTYSGTVPSDVVNVTIGGTPTIHTVNFTAGGTSPFWSFGSSQFIKYDVTVNTNSSEKIQILAGGMTTSLPNTAATGAIDVSVPHTGSCLDTVSFDCISAPINISPLVETMNISNEFNVTSVGSTGITQITNSIIQTPGPLPVVGVGVALGMSRKIRRRITSVA